MTRVSCAAEKLAAQIRATPKNTARQPKASARNPPSTGPATTAAPWERPNHPMAFPRDPGPNRLRMLTWVRLAMTPFMHACATRPAMSRAKLGAAAQHRLARAYDPTAKRYRERDEKRVTRYAVRGMTTAKARA